LVGTEGGVRCVDRSSVDFQCEDAVSYSSSCECPSGQVCGTNGCCSGNNCTQAEVVCANSAAVLRRAAKGERGVVEREVRWNLSRPSGREGIGLVVMW
jgi:hypothetical protein